MTTEEAPFLSLTGRDSLSGIQIESFTSRVFLFFNSFIKHSLWIDREVVFQVLPLSVLHETPSRALTSSVIRTSGSSPLGLAYTTTHSVYNRGTSCSRWPGGKLSSKGF